MIRTLSTILSTTGLVLSLGAGAAVAKGHNQGVAEGGAPGEQTGARDTIDALTELGVLDGKGVSAAVKGGAQGAKSSGAGSDNRTNPTVGNGKNAE